MIRVLTGDNGLWRECLWIVHSLRRPLRLAVYSELEWKSGCCLYIALLMMRLCCSSDVNRTQAVRCWLTAIMSVSLGSSEVCVSHLTNECTWCSTSIMRVYMKWNMIKATQLFNKECIQFTCRWSVPLFMQTFKAFFKQQLLCKNLNGVDHVGK